jgi:xanthine phosphoribosyltransferase
VVDLARQAGATIEGMGFIIEKAFQDGGERIRKEGIFYRALATVESLDDCKIVLRS